MKEVWKPVVGYEGFYEISNFGNVRGINRIITHDWYYRKRIHTTRTVVIKAKILKQQVDNRGYLRANLCRNDGRRGVAMLVHRLVGQAFIPNPDDLPMINHKDENKTNNHVNNLEWCTNSYNINYGTVRQRMANTLRLIHPNCRRVAQIDRNNNIIDVFLSTTDASKKLKNISRQSIGLICRGEYKMMKGLKFKYITEDEFQEILKKKNS